MFEERCDAEIALPDIEDDEEPRDGDPQNAVARRRGKHAAMLQQAKRAMAGGVSDGNLAGLRGIAKQALTDRALDLRVDAGKVRRGRARHEGAGDEGLKRKKKDEGVSENAPT